jgi:hypothetical protein
MHFGRFRAYISALTNLSQRWTTLAHIRWGNTFKDKFDSK